MIAQIYAALEHAQGAPGAHGLQQSDPDHPPSILVNKRAVVVEDEGITQLQIRKILTHAGMKIVGTAANGAKAIEVALQQRPEVVLMDIKMPGEVNGLLAAERILREYRVCIVMLTAYDEEDYQQKAREIGTCGYMTKPVTSELLIPKVIMALERFHQV